MQNLELIDSENGLEISIRDFVDIFNAGENEEWEIDTPDGWQPITNVWVKGNKKTFDVETNDKLKTSVSTKHLFQRGDGEWEFIDNFKIGDTILTKNGKSIISKIFKRGEECVYDVTVNHINHRYFSDGFISHNSGVGKSIMLANLTTNVLKQGYNVVYITLELAEKIVAKRIDSMFTSIAQKSILQNIPKVSHELERIRENSGRLFVKRMRESTTNAKHIVSYLKEFQDVNGITPDLLVIDYLDIMAPIQKIAADNLFGKDKYLSEEIRAVGFDFDCSIASASQMGRCVDVNTKVKTVDGEKFIKDIDIGDRILSQHGIFNIVKAKTEISKLKGYKITTSSGKTIIVSAKHIIPTSRGDLNIENGLTIGDLIITKP